MICIKDLTVKNFMSIGNITQSVSFNTDSLTLVLGENIDQGGDDSGSRNGVGKTSIVNALSYALYGQALTNIKKNNLINKTNNKGMLVTLHFEKNGVDYRIERGRLPNILKFYINDQEQEEDVDESQGDSRKTQETINSLLEMSHDMFKNIVALNTYSEPFLSMRANDQRAIIEQLLGITVLSEKATQLKEEIRSIKDSITEETLKIEAIQTANNNIQQTINSLTTKQNAWKLKHNEDILQLQAAIQEFEKLDVEKEIEAHKIKDSIIAKQSKVAEASKWVKSLESDIASSNATIEKLRSELIMLNDHKCYACGNKLHDTKQEEIKSIKEDALTDLTHHLLVITGQHRSYTASIEELGEIESLPTTFYQTIDEAYNHRSTIESLQKELSLKQQDENPYNAQIVELKETALQPIVWDTVNQLTSLKEHQDFLLKLLTNKDSFIRKKIIDQNLSYLNNRLTYYLDKLGLPHQVIFLNDLSVEISQLGQDLDFDNLSRGERNRLILGLSFAFRDVWEGLYQNINLLFIDELIDSGMDASGVDNALSVLKKFGRDRNKNVFLISHKDELVNRVNTILKVIKDSGFTSFSTDVDIVI